MENELQFLISAVSSLFCFFTFHMMHRSCWLPVFLLFLSCAPEVKFGCEAPCTEKKWLTFDFDKVLLYQDSSSAISHALKNNTLTDYAKSHLGKPVKEENVQFINQTLSCSMWTCTKSEIKRELFDPNHIVIFLKGYEPVAYVALCDKSNSIKCSPDSENKEKEALRGFVHSMAINN